MLVGEFGMDSQIQSLPEPWLRGTLAKVPAVARGVLHALELAQEDVQRWCAALPLEKLEAQPFGLNSVGFQLRHIARSLSRLLAYTEGRELTEMEIANLHAELEHASTSEELFAEFAAALQQSSARVLALATMDLEQPRFVGKLRLPSTLGGLLVHVAEHTQRHVGQAITTAKVLLATSSDREQRS
jgi:uncharacterized damage-inducible protein DinB